MFTMLYCYVISRKQADDYRNRSWKVYSSAPHSAMWIHFASHLCVYYTQVAFLGNKQCYYNATYTMNFILEISGPKYTSWSTKFYP